MDHGQTGPSAALNVSKTFLKEVKWIGQEPVKTVVGMGWWKQKIALLIYVLQNVQGKISSSNDFSIVNQKLKEKNLHLV